MSDGEEFPSDTDDEVDAIDKHSQERATPDLDYDMWEGQFEFVGPSSDSVPQGLLKPPRIISNGVKKDIFELCDGVNNKVYNLFFIFYR